MTTKIDELADKYFETKDLLLHALGYKGNYVEIPLEDFRGDEWMLVGGEGPGARLVITMGGARLTSDVIISGEQICSGPVYTQRFLDKWGDRTETHVLVCCDTQTDVNKFLALLSAEKEVTDENLRKLYLRHW